MVEARAADRLVWSAAAIGLGGILLGLQRQATGELVGTGLRPLGVAALVSVVALVLTFLTGGRGPTEPRLPRDGLGFLSSLSGFAGLTFLTAAVLVPGGSWMFLEALVIVLVLARAQTEPANLVLTRGPSLRHGTLVVFALLLLLRLWVTWQGAHHRWAAIELDVPLLSDIAFLPERLRRISLGEFSATEFGIPRVGLDLDTTLALWGVGFALVAAGLWMRHRNAIEVENDRIQATIEELPGELALLVQRVLPEEEWGELGLHGLGERHRMKRIAALTEARVLRAVEFRDLYRATALPAAANSEFGRAIDGAFRRYRELPPAIDRTETAEPSRPLEPLDPEDPHS